MATAATIIASQSIISGAFSVTQQAVQLGYLPRVRILHTSGEERGQVFAPGVNVLLFIAVAALVLGFGSSTALAAAFGLTVTATMVLTTLMIGFVMLRIWDWNPVWAVPLFALILLLDLGLFAAASTKFMDGGWLPAVIAITMMLVFSTWRRGRTLLVRQLKSETMPIDLFLRTTANVHRIAAAAIYLTSEDEGIPPALLHNLKANQVLHARILLVTVRTAMVPQVDPEARLDVKQLGQGLTRVIVRYGFAESPDVPAALAAIEPPLDPMRSFYFLSRQTLVPSKKPGMAIWRERLFAAMVRSSESPMTFYKLPVNRVVELGSQVEI
jgi:KUP system potassium uptake protein